MNFITSAANLCAPLPKCAAIAAVSIAFGTPSKAQESGVAQLVLDTFAERCADILSNPEAAVAAAVHSDTAGGAVTGDGTLLRYEELPKLTEYTTGFLYATRTRLPSGTESSCGMSITFLPAGDGTIPFPELLDLVGTRAASILGAPATLRGGETTEDGELGHMFLWSTGDSPGDPMLYLTQYPKPPKIVQLGITVPAPTN